jgi:DmsE family decaheme c-type cytochrome
MRGRSVLTALASMPAAILAAVLVNYSGVAVAQQAAAPGAEVCKACHAPYYETYKSHRHGVKGDARTPANAGECAACHGDGTAHVKAGGGRGVGGIVNPGSKTLSAEEKGKICLACHENEARIHWQGSLHDRSQVSCTNCHKLHVERDPVLVKETQASVCFTCHKEQRAAMLRFSAHPLRTGWMACSSCHAPHGSVAEHNLVRNTVNETCYQCHADKRGPFLWEHPPVREECTNCHNPHGTNNAAMLKVRPPYLCQQCHAAPFHPSTLYSGSNLPPNVAADKMLGQQCANCHSKIHGSNHPSGARFTR